ncbi:vesicle transport protein SEC20 [Cimex lectularius]|uniref:Sec20 C-terminal domain-containing protein n=1 Tax=Cimex lectularius TaxID=79782 RepID=A0A8I6RGF3_CIMLE|nr:vesicle transport protein SEC20 [Cimex lectularius]
MEIDQLYVDKLRNDIIKCDLSLKSLIQDIYNCMGPLEVLNELNADGRSKLSTLRYQIEELEVYGKERQNEEIISDAANRKEQYFSTFSMFRKANVVCMLAIDKSGKDELFQVSNQGTHLRQRQKKDKVNFLKMSSGITEQLLSISRHLSDTTQLSADTLNTLANSSTTVLGTNEELQETKSVLFQSGKLLAKYSRRQFTDKLLLLLGFAFFVACILYILKKRVF